MPYYKYPDSVFPESLSFNRFEWQYLIDCFLTNKQTEHLFDGLEDFQPENCDLEPQLVDKTIIDTDEKHAIFWTQDLVISMKSVHEPGPYDSTDKIYTSCLPREKREQWCLI